MFSPRSLLRSCPRMARSLQTTSTTNGPVSTQKRLTLTSGSSAKKSSQTMATFQGQAATAGKIAYKDAPIGKLADTLWMERNVFDYGRKTVVQRVEGEVPGWAEREGLNAA